MNVLNEATALAVQMKADNTDWRRGQCAFAALLEVDPGLAEMIRGTMLDPSNDDRRVMEFWRRVHIESKRAVR